MSAANESLIDTEPALENARQESDPSTRTPRGGKPTETTQLAALGTGASASSSAATLGAHHPSAPSSPAASDASMTSLASQSTSSLEAVLYQKCGIRIPEDFQMKSLVFVSRALPAIAGFGCVIFLIVLVANPTIWKTNDSATDAEKLSRESDRGVFVSVCIAILLNLIGALMFYLKVKESLVVTNYGFILGPVIGYLLDQGIGTDAGFKHFGTADGIDYTFSSLIDGNFMRYIVTVFLDLFISNPLQDIMKNQVRKIGVIDFLKDDTGKHPHLVKYDNFVVLNYPSILQSIVSFITFNAYTNQTRFAWAYASATLDRDLRIPPGTIMLSTAIAAVLYLNFYNIMDYISERQYFDVNTKLIYVMFILGLLYALNATDTIEAPVYGEADENYTGFLGGARGFVGFLVFMGFVCYGFIYPLYTRVGCCGKFKPKSFDEHFADDKSDPNSVAEVKHKVSDDILDKIQEILKDQGIDITQSRLNYEEKQKKRKKRKKRSRFGVGRGNSEHSAAPPSKAVGEDKDDMDGVSSTSTRMGSPEVGGIVSNESNYVSKAAAATNLTVGDGQDGPRNAVEMTGSTGDERDEGVNENLPGYEDVAKELMGGMQHAKSKSEVEIQEVINELADLSIDESQTDHQPKSDSKTYKI